MKPRLFLGLLWGLSCWGQLAAGQQPMVIIPPRALPPVDELVISNVNVVDVDLGEIEPHRNVVMRDGFIISVGKWVPAGRGVPTVDGTGKYLVPGLWDGHTHALASADDERVALPLYVAHGITSIRDVTTARPLNDLLRTHQALETGRRVGPRIELAGPVLDGSDDGRSGLGLAATRAEGRAQAESLIKAGWCSLQTGPLLSRDAFGGIATVAQEWRVRVAGAVPETVPVRDAIGAGQGGIEHPDKLLLACSSREDELVQERALALAGPRPLATLQSRIKAQQKEVVASFSPSRCAALAQALVQYRTAVLPTLVTQDFDLRRDPDPQDPRFRSVPASVRQQWALAARERPHLSAGKLARIREVDSLQRSMVATFGLLGVRLVAGSDAGSGTPNLFHGGSLHDELERLQAIGLTPAEALRAGTVNPAMATGHGFDMARIRAGYLADVVLLNGNPLDDIHNLRLIQAVVLRGRLFDLPALAGLATEAEQAAMQQNVAAQTATAIR
ncbi:amidohydrolase family protein [Hymenobacter armeniacus]|uniref:Amidohydrolase family protein n=1 Tax=Hymenobacter armeniacus TaxID=2771358 RepID=A0ABR8JSY3_9BACT|nr:amidohydrolase family protein [Hymenobacter armeniacus]MBD2721034.1 amidohydrolase family protein [Hymenobacter armeniacus]